MKRYYYNNWLAKVLLSCSTCHTITVGWFVLSKESEDRIPQGIKNHETIHSMQWAEMTMAMGLVLFLIVTIFEVDPWWMLVSPLVYYLWYVLEFCIKSFRFGHRSYKHVSFELEAYENQYDESYVENRHMFCGWMKRIFC